MKIPSRTNILDRAAARAGNRLGCDAIRVMTLSLVVAGSFLLQGCIAGAWVALVAVDTIQNSNVTFGSFEQSWVSKQDQASDGAYHSKVTSVAVLPVEGDQEMGARLA